MIEIDGSYGANVRAKRGRPGLAPRHLAAVRAVAALCDARCEGLEPRATAAGSTELDRAYDELLAAHVLVQKAEAAREAGIEPQPGECIGTVSGGSRLSDEYWERQKEEVELARRRLEQAIARWNAVR